MDNRGRRKIRRSARDNSNVMTLLDEHKQFRKTLQAHKESLVGLNLRMAAKFFLGLNAPLRRHLKLENKWVLPLYKRIGSVPPGGKPEQFIAEHKMILGHLAWLKRSLVGLQKGGKNQRAKVLRHLVRSEQFGSLLEHHDFREKRILYPFLQANASLVERKRLLKRWSLH